MPPAWLRPLTAEDVASPAIGVSIRVIQASGQLHVSVVHRGGAQDPVLLLSQDWHHQLTNQQLKVGGFWVQVPLPESRAIAVAAMCRKIYRTNVMHGLPYGVRFDGGVVLDEGLVELKGATHGLTCATFVMLVFEQSGEPLLRPETWFPRAEDAAWHDWVVTSLARTGASSEHVENVRGEAGCARFRPEEVAAAGACEPKPTDFATVESLGRQARAALLPPPTSAEARGI